MPLGQRVQVIFFVICSEHARGKDLVWDLSGFPDMSPQAVYIEDEGKPSTILPKCCSKAAKTDIEGAARITLVVQSSIQIG